MCTNRDKNYFQLTARGISILMLSLVVACKGEKSLKSLSVEEKVMAPPITEIEIEYKALEDDLTVAETLVSFVVDFSESNYSRKAACFNGTDENDNRLVQMINYINSQKTADNNRISYAIAPFGRGSIAECYRLFNNGSAYFTQNTTDVKNVIKSLIKMRNPNLLTSRPDLANHEDFEDFDDVVAFDLDERCKGGTNYLDGMSAGQTIKSSFLSSKVAQYSQNSPQRAYIFINTLFLSDGEPLILDNNNNLVPQDAELIYSSVMNYMNIKNVNIENTKISKIITTFNTAFYTKTPVRKTNPECASVPAPNDETVAKDLLKNMSFLGKGAFYDLKNNPDYSALKMPTLFSSYDTKTIFLINRNGVWEKKGSVLYFAMDSDGDGVSDEREIALGSDPLTADSNGNGLRDSIDLLLRPGVSPALSFPTNCTEQEKNTDEDLDGLTNCEEKALGMDPRYTDEDGDGVPDGILVQYGINIKNSSHSTDLDGDGISNLDEIRRNLPVKYHNRDISPEIKPQTFYTLENKDSSKTYFVKDFRVANPSQPFHVDIYYYSIQEHGKIRMINKASKVFQPNEKNTVLPEEFIQNFYEESK
jgi:hypothetical protein